MVSLRKIEARLNGRNVLVTGHTGFTGSWLCYWLSKIGSTVTGLALPPHTNPNLYKEAGISNILDSQIGDIRDFEFVKQVFGKSQPSLIIHLAAQPIVRQSYINPVETFQTNVIGTANILEAARNTDGVNAVLNITTDKVYQVLEFERPYRENDVLGGKDPYSASKACSELITSSYRETMTGLGNGMVIGVVRGGNIIGGGDWSEDRIVPDFYRAILNKTLLEIRNPYAIRPWQHVLSVCHAYLAVATHLLCDQQEQVLSPIWNVGPSEQKSITVSELVKMLSEFSENPPDILINKSKLLETQSLLLDSSKIKNELKISSPWSINKSVEKTALWYEKSLRQNRDLTYLLQHNLEEYLYDCESFRSTV